MSENKEGAEKIKYKDEQKVAADFELYSFTQRSKFEYTFAALIFGSMALSFQYSPKMGIHYPLVLIFSWFLYFISASVSGYRVYRWIWFERRKVQMFISYALNADQNGNKASPHNIAARKELEKLNKFFPVQCWLYFLGLFFNGIFATINYLVKAKVINFHRPFYNIILAILTILGMITIIMGMIYKQKISKKNQKETLSI